MSETTMPYNGYWRQAGDLFECLGEEESTRVCQRLAIDVKVAPVDIAPSICCCSWKVSTRRDKCLFHPLQNLQLLFVITQRVDNHLLKLLLQKIFFDNATWLLTQINGEEAL